MNIKKIGLTALAGSLVATSAMAGELSLSGGAKLSYVSNGGSNDSGTKAGGFAMDQEISASGSGELDNGFTVTLTHGMSGEETAKSDTSFITLDMGDMGTLTYSDADIGGGLTALDNIMPTVYEEANDGVGGSTSANVAAMPSGQGFAYSTSIGGAAVSVNFSDNLSATADRTDGETDSGSVSARDGSSSSIGITLPVSDLGLTVFGGTGTQGQADDKDIDHTTYGLTYAYGPVTVGYQYNDQDDSASTSAVDLETTIYGASFMVNDNLSLSYQEMETEKDGTTADQEIDSIQLSYSMGGVSINVKDSEGTNIGNTTSSAHETTEVLVTFAF
jgi:outer membrane protein OmpU